MSLGGLEPIAVFTLLNVAFTVALYISNLSGQLSLATAAIGGLASYASAVMTTRLGISFAVALVAGCVLGAVIGGTLGALTARMRDFILKLVTLAFGEAVVVAIFNIDYLGGANSFTGITLHTTPLGCATLAAVALAIGIYLDRTVIGFAARAIRDDPLAAASMGVPIVKVRVITLAVSCALIGAGGVLQAHYLLVINPHDLTFFVSLNYVIFLIFGGMYSVFGALVGAVILTILPESLRFASEYRLILFGIVITAVVLIRPEGLVKRRPLGQRPMGRVTPTQSEKPQ